MEPRADSHPCSVSEHTNQIYCSVLIRFLFPDMKVSGILRLTGDGIEFAVCSQRKVARDRMMKACLASPFGLSRAVQREEKLVKTLIVAIKGY